MVAFWRLWDGIFTGNKNSTVCLYYCYKKKPGIFVKAKKKKYILQLKYIRGFHSHPLGQSLQKKNTIRDGNYPKLKQGNLSKFFHQNWTLNFKSKQGTRCSSLSKISKFKPNKIVFWPNTIILLLLNTLLEKVAV